MCEKLVDWQHCSRRFIVTFIKMNSIIGMFIVLNEQN